MKWNAKDDQIAKNRRNSYHKESEGETVLFPGCDRAQGTPSGAGFAFWLRGSFRLFLSSLLAAAAATGATASDDSVPASCSELGVASISTDLGVSSGGREKVLL